MKLNVLESGEPTPLWYANGLRFHCTQCGNCCTGAPGYVWISSEEINHLAEHLNLTRSQVIDRYCRKIDGRFSLNELKNLQRGEYDCVFLREEFPAPTPENPNPSPKRTCSVYSARPLQCRTWPFWTSALANRETWQQSGRRCEGINQGKLFSAEEIEAFRKAREWPKNPPG